MEILKWNKRKHTFNISRHVHKPKDKEQLIEGIKKFWRNKMSVAQYLAYVGHISHVIPKVIRAGGGNIYE